MSVNLHSNVLAPTGKTNWRIIFSVGAAVVAAAFKVVVLSHLLDPITTTGVDESTLRWLLGSILCRHDENHDDDGRQINHHDR